MKMKRISVAAASLACCAAVLVPSAANAQEPPSPAPPSSTQDGGADQGTDGGVVARDASVSNQWVRMYLSGNPSRWYASLSNNVPGGAGLGHYEVYGPNGFHWNSPERVNPQTSATGTGAGQVCAQLWIQQANGSYQSAGRPCAGVS